MNLYLCLMAWRCAETQQNRKRINRLPSRFAHMLTQSYADTALPCLSADDHTVLGFTARKCGEECMALYRALTAWPKERSLNHWSSADCMCIQPYGIIHTWMALCNMMCHTRLWYCVIQIISSFLSKSKFTRNTPACVTLSFTSKTYSDDIKQLDVRWTAPEHKIYVKNNTSFDVS